MITNTIIKRKLYKPTLGYFTSKISGELFSNEQFKVFQAKLEDPNFTPKTVKTQFFVPFDNAESIAANEVKIVEGGTEYIQSCSKEKRLTDILKKLEEKPYKEFNPQGISKEDCLKMCLEHDENVKNNKTHPLTADQIKLNDLNKQKQKDLVLNNKKKILENNDENETKDF
jgi:hypothetical protein